MTSINKQSLSNECCLCRGTTATLSAGSAYVMVNGVEHRLFYHKSCLTDENKSLVEEMLHQMATQQTQESK
mgnify:CR=1 FL=1